MRLQALKRLGFDDVPCIIIPQETPVEKLRNYIIKDNGDFGDWDYKALLDGWDAVELQEWAIDIPQFEEQPQEKKRELSMFPRFAEKVYIRAIRELMEQGKYDQFDNPQQVFHWWISNQNSKEWLFKHNQPKLF